MEPPVRNFESIRRHIKTSGFQVRMEDEDVICIELSLEQGTRHQAIFLSELDDDDGRPYLRVSTAVAPTTGLDARNEKIIELAMLSVLVDTAPWIYLLEDHAEFAPRFVGLFEAAERGQIQLALSTVSLAEVLTGPLKAGQTALAKRYETALGAYQVVPLSAAVASLAAQLRVQYRLKLPDAVQLASALDIGAAALVTHDRDFSAVQGLPVLMGP